MEAGIFRQKENPIELSSNHDLPLPHQAPSAQNGTEWHQKVFPNPSKGTELSKRAPVDQKRQLALDKKDAG